jgi:hypothetical protein
LRPDFLFPRETTSDFSGRFFVISVKVWPLALRRPGEVGLNCFMGMA